MKFHAVRVACVVVLLAAGVPAWAQKDKKDDKGKAREVIAAAAHRAKLRAQLVAELRGRGVSAATAGLLAQDIVNGFDPKATDEEKKTSDVAVASARLLDDLASELSQLGAKPAEIAKVAEEIAARRLTDGSPGGAARNLAGLPAIDAIIGDGSTRKLPPAAGRNADAIARALNDAIVEMHTVGLTDKDPIFNSILDTILRRGLYGSEARNLVRGVTGPMVEDQRKKQDPPPGGDKDDDKKDRGYQPPATDKDPDGDGRRGPAPFVPERNPAPGGGGGEKPDGGTSKEDKPAPAAGGSGTSTGRQRAVIDFSDDSTSTDGKTDSTTETPAERADRKKSEAEAKAKAEEEAKKDKDAKKDDDDDEDEDDKGPPRSPDQPSASTSLDPGGDQAYRAKPTLKGILDRVTRLQGKRGQQTNPAPGGNDAPDRTVPIRDPKTGLIGNPGAAGTRVQPQIDPKKVMKPGPKPGQVDPVRDSGSNSSTGSGREKNP